MILAGRQAERQPGPFLLGDGKPGSRELPHLDGTGEEIGRERLEPLGRARPAREQAGIVTKRLRPGRQPFDDAPGVLSGECEQRVGDRHAGRRVIGVAVRTILDPRAAEGRDHALGQHVEEGAEGWRTAAAGGDDRVGDVGRQGPGRAGQPDEGGGDRGAGRIRLDGDHFRRRERGPAGSAEMLAAGRGTSGGENTDGRVEAEPARIGDQARERAHSSTRCPARGGNRAA